MDFACVCAFALVLVSPGCRSAESADHTVDRAGSSTSQAASVRIVDVEPGNPFDGLALEHLEAQVLLPDAESKWWARIPGGAIALVAPEFEDDEFGNNAFDVNVPWSVVWTTARFPSWRELYSDQYPDRREFEREGFDFQIESRTVSIDGESANAIAAAWRSVLRRARHSPPVLSDDGKGHVVETMFGRFDGSTYDFRADEFYGTTWSPDPGPAADLVNLATDLAAVVRTNPTDLDARLRELGKRARALRERVESLPW